EKLDFDRDMQVAALSEAQAQYYLGDLLLHISRLDVAETQLQKAIALDSKLPAAYASLGLLSIRKQDNEKALKYLSQAMDGDSKNHLAHYRYAYLLESLDQDESPEQRKSRLQMMRTHLQKTIELAPRFIDAYNMLGYVALLSKEGTVEAEDVI